MSRLLLAVLFAAFAAGCGKRPVPAPRPAPDTIEEEPEALEPPDPKVVKLPEAEGAAPLVKGEDYVIFLNVNFKGQVLLSPADTYRDANGDVVATLENAAQAELFLKRRAVEDRAAAGPAAADMPLRSVVILRVDAQAPFERYHGILKAAARAGFTKMYWRAVRPKGKEEGQLPAAAPEPADEFAGAIPSPVEEERPVRYVSRVTAADDGTIAGMTFGGLDIKTDTAALSRKLRALKLKYKDRRVIFVFELDGKLLHSEVVRLIDISVRAGFPDAQLVLLDPKKR